MAHIDHLTVTIPPLSRDYDALKLALDAVYAVTDMTTKTGLPVSARNYHKSRGLDVQGIQFYWTPESDGYYPVTVSLSGDVLGRARALHESERYITLNEIATATRIDIAIDVLTNDSHLSAEKLATLVHKQGNVVAGHNKGGFTIYVGSRNSPTFYRIYDKHAESGSESDKFSVWTRLEVEYKRNKARAVFSTIKPGKKYGGIALASFAKIMDTDAIKPFVDSEQQNVKASEVPESDTQAWLMRTVLPSLAKEISTDSAFADRFISALSARANMKVSIEKDK